MSWLKIDESRGRRLQELREKRGFTQRQVAEHLGVEKGSVSRWETGKVFPRDHLPKLCALYGCDPEYIIFGIAGADVQTYPAFEAYVKWLKANGRLESTPNWLIEQLRTLRLRLPDDLEPDLHVYMLLHSAMEAMKKKQRGSK